MKKFMKSKMPTTLILLGVLIFLVSSVFIVNYGYNPVDEYPPCGALSDDENGNAAIEMTNPPESDDSVSDLSENDDGNDTPDDTDDEIPDDTNCEEDDEVDETPEPIRLPEPISITNINNLQATGTRNLELPVVGATGWAGAEIQLMSLPQLPPEPDEPEEYGEYANNENEENANGEENAQQYEYTENEETGSGENSDDNETIDYNEETSYSEETYEDEDASNNEEVAQDDTSNQDVQQAPAAQQEQTAPNNAEDDEVSEVIATLNPGQVFRILREYGEWWRVRLPSGVEGWVMHEACFINLPDVIPSIVLNISNARESLKSSAGYDIPNVTGYALYNAFARNPRFDREMYIVPVLYATSLRLFTVQQRALSQGETIVMYEAFRPAATQRRVVTGLQALMRENETVNEAINTPPWSLGWFIAQGGSQHQRGVAVDVSLARIVSYEIATTTNSALRYRYINEYVMHNMPTIMHDLHPNAASLVGPGSTELAPGMTEGAVLLRSLFTGAGFTPIASEWWHFTDSAGAAVAQRLNMAGNFFTETVLSS